MANPILMAIDDLVARWNQIVVPIFVNDENSESAANGLGTGFIISNNQSYFLITALHVVTDANHYKHQVANINGKGIYLGGLKFAISDEYDIAVAELDPDWLLSQGLEKIKALPFQKKSAEWERTGIFLLVGYPGTKNKLNPVYGRVKRYMHSITVTRSNRDLVETEVKDALQFDYDPKTVVNSDLVNLGGQPDLPGMSGGPVLEVLRNKTDENHSIFSVELTGILSEWYRAERFIIAAPSTILETLMYDITNANLSS